MDVRFAAPIMARAGPADQPSGHAHRLQQPIGGDGCRFADEPLLRAGQFGER